MRADKHEDAASRHCGSPSLIYRSSKIVEARSAAASNYRNADH
jgi:hypothetical protein